MPRCRRALPAAPRLLVSGVAVGFSSVAGGLAPARAGVRLATAAVGCGPLSVPFHVHTDHAPKAAA